jgi:hypothetical protein
MQCAMPQGFSNKDSGTGQAAHLMPHRSKSRHRVMYVNSQKAAYPDNMHNSVSKHRDIVLFTLRNAQYQL